MLVDIYEIDSTDTPSATSPGLPTRLMLKQCMNRSFSTVGASVQTGIVGGGGTPSEQVRAPLRMLQASGAAATELIALGNHGQIFVVFCTLAEVQAMVAAGPIPNT